MQVGDGGASRSAVWRRFAFLLALWVTVLVVGRVLLVDRLGLPPEAPFLLLGFISAPFVLTRYFWAGMVVPATVGLACPACATRPLSFVRAISFGHRFYLCPACGRRFKRTNMDEPWEQADGPRDLPFYLPKPKTMLTRGEEWAWAAIFVGALLAWPASVALGSWFAGVPGLVTGTCLATPLVDAMFRRLARMKETAHRARHRDAVDGLA